MELIASIYVRMNSYVTVDKYKYNERHLCDTEQKAGSKDLQ